jgi:hypothetical protein
MVFLFQKAFYSLYQCDDFDEATEMLNDYPDYFDIVIIFSTAFSTESFLFINRLKKINSNLEYINISEPHEVLSDYNHCMFEPVRSKQLLEKVYNLCIFDYKTLDTFLFDVEKEYKSQRTALEISEDDLIDMSDLIDDFENIISELIYDPSMNIEDIDFANANILLQRTYNVFYTFIDEDIKDAIEPFSIALLSFIDTVHSIEVSHHNSKLVLDGIVLILEDILRFIQNTVNTGHYIHSQYLLDSFLSNIECLKGQAGLIEEEDDEDDCMFF